MPIRPLRFRFRIWQISIALTITSQLSLAQSWSDPYGAINKIGANTVERNGNDARGSYDFEFNKIKRVGEVTFFQSQFGGLNCYDVNVFFLNNINDSDPLTWSFESQSDAQQFKQILEEKVAQVKEEAVEQPAVPTTQASQPTDQPPPYQPYQPPQKLADLLSIGKASIITNAVNHDIVNDVDELLAQKGSLGDEIDSLLESRQSPPLDNLPEPKQPGDKGEWRTKSGLEITAWGSDFLFLNANVVAVVCDSHGFACFSGPYLSVYNGGRKPFYFTSITMGFGANMIVKPGETYRSVAPVYRNNTHDFLTIDISATYWHETQ